MKSIATKVKLEGKGEVNMRTEPRRSRSVPEESEQRGQRSDDEQIMEKEVPALCMGAYELKFENGEDIGAEMKEVARKELRESPEVVTNAIETLRELLKGDTDLYVPLEDDSFLVEFLRPCKYYPDSARALLRRYYAFKTRHSKLYAGLTPNSARNILSQNILTVLPKRDQHGRRILLVEAGVKWKPSQCTLDEIMQGCILMLEAAMKEPKTQVAGAVAVLDTHGLGLAHVCHFTPAFAGRVVEWVQIYLHGADKDSLLKHINASSLPVQYGGNMKLPTVDGKDWINFFLKYENEYKDGNQYGFKLGAKVKV